MNIFLIFIASILSSIGLGIAIVEKGEKWPVKPLREKSSNILEKIHPNFPDVFECIPCVTFWAALICDTILFVYFGFSYFLWPISGLAAFGVIWTIIWIINVIDTDIDQDE